MGLEGVRGTRPADLNSLLPNRSGDILFVPEAALAWALLALGVGLHRRR